MSHVFVDKHRHLLPQSWISWPSLMLNGVTIHANFEALFKSTCTALISMCFVYHAEAIRFWFADILAISSNRSFEESSTAIASINSIMFARTVISTDFARHIVKNSTWKRIKRFQSQIKLQGFESKSQTWNLTLIFMLPAKLFNNF